MRVLVTGGAGYIGSTLVRLLLQRGHQVTVLDRFFFGGESLKGVSGQVRLVRKDTRNVGKSDLEGIEAVIDMAALSNDPAGELDPAKTLQINHLARARIARLAKEMGVQRYILASSCSVYGFQQGEMTELSPAKPLSTYANANVLWERDALPLASEKFCVTSLRQATVYGPSYRMRFDLAVNGMVLGFYKSGKIPIQRDGFQWRPFVHVADTSMAFALALEAEAGKVSGQVFNVGSNDGNYQILPLGKLVAKAVGKPFEYDWYGSPDSRSYTVNFDKIRDVLGFKPEFDAADGARQVYQALAIGAVDSGPKTNTVGWYKHLLEGGEDSRQLELDGLLI